MQRIWSTQLAAHSGQRVQIAGWLHRLRQLSNVGFLIVRDGFGLIQIVVDPVTTEQLANFLPETVLMVEGQVVLEPQAPGGVELHQANVHVLNTPAVPPPFEMFRPTIPAQLPTLLDYAPVALRHPRQRAFFQLAAASLAGFRQTLTAQGFTEIQTPKIVASATEGGANVFQIDYFGQPAYLAQSPQFYKQTMVGVFERVFEVGPVFRAEPHATPRHINQYTSLDVELGFIQSYTDVMAVVSSTLRGMLEHVAQQTTALRLLKLQLPRLPEQIPVISFRNAQALIEQATGEDLQAEPDLAPAHERWLGEWALREHGSDFVFVTGYPMVKRPFYTHPDPLDPSASNSFDLIFRGLELVTGGQRLHQYADYLAALAARGLNPEAFAGYLQAFQYGMPPHGGFAIGLERWVARLTEVSNIRETTLFPRDMQRLTP